MAETKKLQRKPIVTKKQGEVKQKMRKDAPALEDGFRYDYDDSSDMQS